jgi:HIV Tat-specific factor 1
MTVKFRDPISAKACIIVSPPFHRCTPTSFSLTPNLQKMQGRFFAGRRVEAYLYTGQQRFKRSKGEDDDMLGDGADSERKRLDDFAQWLMDEGEA